MKIPANVSFITPFLDTHGFKKYFYNLPWHMQHQQHVEDKEEIMSVPEDVIVRNSEKKNFVSMPLHIPSHWKECVFQTCHNWKFKYEFIWDLSIMSKDYHAKTTGKNYT